MNFDYFDVGTSSPQYHRMGETVKFHNYPHTAAGGLAMPSANTIDGEDGASRSRKRAYFNKSRDHARQNHDDVEILGGEPSDSPVSVDTCVPTCRRLIPDEVEAIVTNGGDTRLTDRLSGDAAQALIDSIQEVLDLPGPSPWLRRKCLSALCHICSRQALLPKTLQIPLCYNRLEVPRYRGGFADVWMGDYQGQRVAAKVLRIYTTSDLDKIRRRFCKEVLRWKALSHPNVLSLLGVTIDKDHFVMVSEWMENGNIVEFVKTHRDVNRFELLKDVAKGLIYMHDQSMVHGDLKGANILIDKDGHARLADFGFLAIISDPANPTVSSSYTVGGTVRWMSPELLASDQSGPKSGRPTKQSDCYAFGMVIYEVLSGRVPFSKLKHYIVIRKVMDGERPERPKGAEGAWFTDELWRMVTRCWATQPESRPSVVEVLECLERVRRDSGAPSSQADGDLGMDEDDWNLASNSSRQFSWFDPYCFVALLHEVLC